MSVSILTRIGNISHEAWMFIFSCPRPCWEPSQFSAQWEVPQCRHGPLAHSATGVFPTQSFGKEQRQLTVGKFSCLAGWPWHPTAMGIHTAHVGKVHSWHQEEMFGTWGFLLYTHTAGPDQVAINYNSLLNCKKIWNNSDWRLASSELAISLVSVTAVCSALAKASLFQLAAIHFRQYNNLNLMPCGDILTLSPSLRIYARVDTEMDWHLHSIQTPRPWRRQGGEEDGAGGTH